ncbi:MAG TPA: TonB-dependent receptor [Mariniphaga sp.]|nr:TonB-dependent receptor [Mariniphaga sp.]
MKKYYFLFILTLFPALLSAQNATISGRVSDAVTNEPLPFVNVVVSGTTIGTVTDINGNFLLKGLKSGFIRLEASFVGYKTKISSEVEVSSARTNSIEIMMEEQKEQLDEVTVTASPFRKTEESPVSLRSIGIGEIEKYPGANRDISKVIQSFPGVQSTAAYRNDVIIRGGGPSESRFYLDGVEVPFINHFATQGASGGPVGIINADFLREVNFYSGAFPANRGNALSGVLEFNQVDGNKDKMKFQGTVGASEVGVTLDGPIGDKTTYIFSARRSYLQLLFSALELPFLPNFSDMQFKLRTRIDKKNEITFIGLGAVDVFDLNLGIENPDEQQTSILSRIPVNEQWNYTLGTVYRHYSNHSYQTVVISRSHLNNESYKYLDNDDSSEDNKILDYLSQEIENKLRFESSIRLDGYKLNTGFNLEQITYENNTQQQRFYGDSFIDINYETQLNLLKWGLFAQISKNLFKERLVLSAGFRTDANNYSSSMNNLPDQLSPRFSASFLLSDQWSLNFNTGRYYQLPPLTTLGFKMNDNYINKRNNLTYIQSDHLIGGLEYRPRQSVQLTLEGFWKGYNNYPYSVKDKISLANKGADFGVIGDEEVLSNSEGRAFGAEFQARVNTPKGFNLNLSYTLVRSEFMNDTKEYIPTGWDARHLLNVTSTTELKRGWRVGGRWRYVGGLPYTPYDMDRSSFIEAWNITGGPYFDFNQLNAARFSPFHQLDIRIDKSFYLDRVTAKFYIDVQNIYNFQAEQQDIIVRETNDAGNFVTTDNDTRYSLRRVTNTTGTVLPTVGIIVAF